jgi:hypothetical protein
MTSPKSLKNLFISTALTACFAVAAYGDNISFSTFVTSSNIAAATGQNSTIAFTYAGNKFVGSVYNGDNQLYQTNLNGTVVTPFGTPIASAGGELVLGASLGKGGFANGNIFAGSGANGNIYQYANSGGAPALFATVPTGQVRQIFFDPGSSFGGNMLVTTTAGNIYQVTSGGVVTPLASVGEDTEGMDIASSAWGPYAGDLLVTSEGSGSLRLISPGGVVTVVGFGGEFPGAETVSTVPQSLDPSDPLQGFYVANFANDIQFAAASNFTSQGLGGDVLVTDEFGGSTMWDVHYNGSGFDVTPFAFTGNLISQFEDGIFVTPQRIGDTGGGSVPEPSSIALLGTAAGLAGLALRRRRATR